MSADDPRVNSPRVRGRAPGNLAVRWLRLADNPAGHHATLVQARAPDTLLCGCCARRVSLPVVEPADAHGAVLLTGDLPGKGGRKVIGVGSPSDMEGVGGLAF